MVCGQSSFNTSLNRRIIYLKPGVGALDAATVSQIPTQTSQLTNNSGYITKEFYEFTEEVLRQGVGSMEATISNGTIMLRLQRYETPPEPAFTINSAELKASLFSGSGGGYQYTVNTSVIVNTFSNLTRYYQTAITSFTGRQDIDMIRVALFVTVTKGGITRRVKAFDDVITDFPGGKFSGNAAFLLNRTPRLGTFS